MPPQPENEANASDLGDDSPSWCLALLVYPFKIFPLQAFVQKLAVCLLDGDRNPNSPMVDQMNTWTAEATCFVSSSLLHENCMFCQRPAPILLLASNSKKVRSPSEIQCNH